MPRIEEKVVETEDRPKKKDELLAINIKKKQNYFFSWGFYYIVEYERKDKRRSTILRGCNVPSYLGGIKQRPHIWDTGNGDMFFVKDSDQIFQLEQAWDHSVTDTLYDTSQLYT